MKWPRRDLRLTRVQADFLMTGDSSIHQKITERTELILEARRMLTWKRSADGTYRRGLTAKGEAAIKQWNERGNP